MAAKRFLQNPRWCPFKVIKNVQRPSNTCRLTPVWAQPSCGWTILFSSASAGWSRTNPEPGNSVPVFGHFLKSDRRLEEWKLSQDDFGNVLHLIFEPDWRKTPGLPPIWCDYYMQLPIFRWDMCLTSHRSTRNRQLRFIVWTTKQVLQQPYT